MEFIGGSVVINYNVEAKNMLNRVKLFLGGVIGS